ncbi:hypothetical protein PoHVEF18_007100 [Penicillium ochrochloron]
MAHSKRNTSLPHFTSYERNLLRSTWGTKRSVIGRDSFLPFASCRLCLQPARAPVVACASNGDLFCRECAINDLLAQRQEIKRLEKDREEAKKRIAEDEERMLEEARKKDLRDFELVSMGLDAARSGANNGRKRKVGVDEEEEERALAAFKAREVEVNGVRKKVFELDEKEMARVASEERERLKGEIKKEKDSSKSALPSFWVPSLTPSTDHNEITANKAVKLTPMCPGSNETHKHSYSLKSLVDVHFTEEKAEDGTVSRVCPSCKKNLSNGLKAMHPHASKEEQAKTAALHGLVLCYVCETDITPNGDVTGPKKKSKKKEKDVIQPGLVAISSEGTGFAGGGGNVATKTGVAFQC